MRSRASPPSPMPRRRFLVLGAAALTASASRLDEPLRVERFRALGAEATIALPGPPERATRAFRASREAVEAVEHSFSLWRPGSHLSRLNAEGAVAGPGALFSDLVAKAAEIAALSGGGFDPTIQPLWRALAEGGDPRAARTRVGWQALHATEERAWFDRPGMAASFNGIAQGYAADRVVQVLEGEGYRAALVNLGEYRAVGVHPLGRAWRLGIGAPGREDLVATVALPVSGQAMATSEPGALRIGGRAHVLDPLDRPGPRWASVTVAAPTAWRADGLSTAIAAAPVGEEEALLAKGGASAAWLIDGEGRLTHWQTA